jgi:hypothetical protein
MRLEDRAERVRAYFRNLPGFTEMMHQRRKAAEAGDLIPLEALLRQWGLEEEYRLALAEASDPEVEPAAVEASMRQEAQAERIREHFAGALQP